MRSGPLQQLMRHEPLLSTLIGEEFFAGEEEDTPAFGLEAGATFAEIACKDCFGFGAMGVDVVQPMP